MAFEKLVCPECGCSEFSLNCPAIVKMTYEVSAHGECEIGEEVLDIDRDGDYTCEDCGEEYGSAQELVTQEAYNAEEECERCGAEENDQGFCTDPDCPQ